MTKGLGSWENAPLVLACVDVEFGQRASFTSETEKLGSLQQSAKYPRFEQGLVRGFTFATDQQQGVSLQDTSTPLVQYRNAPSTVAFRVAHDRLTFFDADYSGNFKGLLGRFLEVYQVWFDAAPGLSLSKLSYRTFDVVSFDELDEIGQYLRTEWCAGMPTTSSSGLATRDTYLADGSRHFRVRNGVAEKERQILLANDLPIAPVTLPSIAGPFDKDQLVAVVDIERKLTVTDGSLQAIEEALHGLHREIDIMFEAVFTTEALSYFHGNV